MHAKSLEDSKVTGAGRVSPRRICGTNEIGALPVGRRPLTTDCWGDEVC